VSRVLREKSSECDHLRAQLADAQSGLMGPTARAGEADVDVDTFVDVGEGVETASGVSAPASVVTGSVKSVSFAMEAGGGGGAGGAGAGPIAYCLPPPRHPTLVY